MVMMVYCWEYSVVRTYHSSSFSHSLKGICVAGLWWIWWELHIGFCVSTFHLLTHMAGTHLLEINHWGLPLFCSLLVFLCILSFTWKVKIPLNMVKIREENFSAGGKDWEINFLLFLEEYCTFIIWHDSNKDVHILLTQKRPDIKGLFVTMIVTNVRCLMTTKIKGLSRKAQDSVVKLMCGLWAL
jgi:hypothetical protein